MPIMGGGHGDCGDMHVEIQVLFPSALHMESQQLIQIALLNEDIQDEESPWWAQFQQMYVDS